MATVSKLMLGAVIAAVSIASPAFAQYASQSDPSISVQHSKYVKKSSHRNGYDAFGTVPALLIGMSPYSIAVLADNNNLRLDLNQR
jgi:hypothetical protein